VDCGFCPFTRQRDTVSSMRRYASIAFAAGQDRDATRTPRSPERLMPQYTNVRFAAAPILTPPMTASWPPADGLTRIAVLGSKRSAAIESATDRPGIGGQWFDALARRRSCAAWAAVPSIVPLTRLMPSEAIGLEERVMSYPDRGQRVALLRPALSSVQSPDWLIV
jgi:hypothetical protein